MEEKIPDIYSTSGSTPTTNVDGSKKGRKRKKRKKVEKENIEAAKAASIQDQLDRQTRFC